MDLFRAALLSRSLRKILRGAAQDDTIKRRGGNVAAGMSRGLVATGILRHYTRRQFGSGEGE